ncbi:MAG: hypothetical protein WD510_02720, partial [Balneolaceae bacterium]
GGIHFKEGWIQDLTAWRMIGAGILVYLPCTCFKIFHVYHLYIEYYGSAINGSGIFFQKQGETG